MFHLDGRCQRVYRDEPGQEEQMGITERLSRRRYVRSMTGAASAAVLAAQGVALRAAHAQETDPGLMPPGPEESRPRVPALEKTILLDADWIGTDNARGRHAQFWIDTWAEHHPTYKLDFQAAGDTIVRLASDTSGHMIQFRPPIFSIFKGKPGLFVDITRDMGS